MGAKPSQQPGPIDRFSTCHAGILSRFERLRRLPALLADPADLPAARQFAKAMVGFIREAVFEHHAEEEQALFPAVARSAAAGDERRMVEALIARLTREHRELEALWAEVEPAMKALAHGKPAEIDRRAVDRLCRSYASHAGFEEEVWLPLAERILTPGAQAELGLALHQRHGLDQA